MIFCNEKAKIGIGILKAIQLETDVGKTTPCLQLESLAAEGEASALPCGVLPEKPTHGSQGMDEGMLWYFL